MWAGSRCKVNAVQARHHCPWRTSPALSSPAAKASRRPSPTLMVMATPTSTAAYAALPTHA
jgi:hypothetical protein